MILREATIDDLPTAAALVRAVFQEAIAPLYGPEGVRAFLDYVHPAIWTNRHRHDQPTWVALDDGDLVGVLHVRDGHHLSLLFVATRAQRRGIARRLLELAIRHLPPEDLTVNASPNSVEAYTHLGFEPTGPETTTDGLRYTPMRRPARSSGA